MPRSIDGRFAELAALLKTADRLFQEVRDALQEHWLTRSWETVRHAGMTELVGGDTLKINKDQFPSQYRSACWDIVLLCNTNVTNRLRGRGFTDAIAAI